MSRRIPARGLAVATLSLLSVALGSSFFAASPTIHGDAVVGLDEQ